MNYFFLKLTPRFEII